VGLTICNGTLHPLSSSTLNLDIALQWPNSESDGPLHSIHNSDPTFRTFPTAFPTFQAFISSAFPTFQAFISSAACGLSKSTGGLAEGRGKQKNPIKTGRGLGGANTPYTESTVKVFLPNSANLQNVTGFLRGLDLSNPEVLEFSMHPKWVAVHPVVLAITASLATKFRESGGTVVGGATQVPTLNYLIRMGLFKHLGIESGKEIKEHEESGRFIPLTQIKNTDELKQAIVNLVPLLHAPPAVADPIKYVFSEMVRNALEHSQSSVGAFVCAQYYRETKRIAIGIADAGIGVFESMRRYHFVKGDEGAIRLALQPGITGTTSRIGGNEFNAGAGLFFTKSIATLSRNYFFLYSGTSMFRLMKTRQRYDPELHTDPKEDPHAFVNTPDWKGTVVGIDLNIEQGVAFAELLNQIRGAYSIDVKSKKNYANKIRFRP
jgi:anti-sigma regulatory factor (Ser/Thr protein kinase)